MSRTDLPTGTVTVLFTDIEGSTKLLHELGPQGYAGALADHRQLLRAAFVHHGGVEMGTEGDASFYAFPTASGALAAAADGLASDASGSKRGSNPDRDSGMTNKPAGQVVGAGGLEPPTFAL